MCVYIIGVLQLSVYSSAEVYGFLVNNFFLSVINGICNINKVLQKSAE